MKQALVVLEDEDQLRELALLVYRQEENAVHSIGFKSEHERVKYMNDCRSSYEKIISILDEAGITKNKLKDDKAKESIANDIYSYVVKGINSALQTFRNYYLRLEYMGKIKDHASALITALEELAADDVEATAKLVKTATYFRDAMDQCLAKSQSWQSTAFTRWLKDSGLKMKDFVKKYQVELGYEGEFDALEEWQKLKVLNRIAVASGRGSIVAEVVDTSLAGVGAGVLILALGTMVWDIYLSDRPVETGVRDLMQIASGLGGAAIGEFVEAGLVAFATEVEIDSIFLACVGFVTGTVAAILIADAAAALIILIFGSGGSAPLNPGKHRCYVAPMPDGAALARQIAHNHKRRSTNEAKPQESDMA